MLRLFPTERLHLFNYFSGQFLEGGIDKWEGDAPPQSLWVSVSHRSQLPRRRPWRWRLPNTATKGCGGRHSTAPSPQRSRCGTGPSCMGPAPTSLRIFIFGFYILPLISPTPSHTHTSSFSIAPNKQWSDAVLWNQHPRTTEEDRGY